MRFFFQTVQKCIAGMACVDVYVCIIICLSRNTEVNGVLILHFAIGCKLVQLSICSLSPAVVSNLILCEN